MIGHAVQAVGVLALTMALALWATAGGSVAVASPRLEAPATALTCSHPSKAPVVMDACRNGVGAGHRMFMSIAACAAHCALNAATIPLGLDLPAIASSCAVATEMADAEGHFSPPDPPPPRAVVTG